MKWFRYRRPSLNTLLGITSAKKRLNRELGITAFLKPFRWFSNQKRRIKRKLGYESEIGRAIRYGLPKPMGCTSVFVAFASGLILFVFAWMVVLS